MVDPNGGPQWWFWASFSNETGFSSSWLSWALSKVPVAQSKKSKKRPKRCVCCVCRKTHIHTYVNIQRKHTDLPWLPRYWFRYVTPSLMVVLSFRFEWCFWASYHVHARYMCYPLPNGGLGFRVDSFELPFLMILMKQDSWAHGFHGPCPKFQSPNRRRRRRGSSRPIKEIKEEAEEVCLLEVSCLCPSPYRSDTLVGRALNSNQEH